MAKMSRNIVFEGWLTKSPPSKRIWRTKWRRRWFALRQSGELPGQYFLDYYADRNCRRLKGTINLDFCEQVDAGLHMERGSNGAMDPKMRGSVFTIQTQTRIYHLEADCESEMEKWVDAICRVCGLRAIDDAANVTGVYQNHAMTVGKHEKVTMRVKSNNKNDLTDIKKSSGVNNLNYNTVFVNEQQNNDMTLIADSYDCSEGTGPYIAISECITGARAQDMQRAFTFDTKNIVTSTKMPFDRTSYLNQPQIRVTNVELSENESNVSEDECRSLNASQSIGELTVTKSFTKMSMQQPRHGGSENGPPVPPRPPKTFAMSKELTHKESFHGPKIQEPVEENASPFPWLRLPRRASQSLSTAPPSPGCSNHHGVARTTDDEEDNAAGHAKRGIELRHSTCNASNSVESGERKWNGVPQHWVPKFPLPPLPCAGYSVKLKKRLPQAGIEFVPTWAVDRALKPRHSSHSIGNVHGIFHGVQVGSYEEAKSDGLQYLDLDLQSFKPPTNTKEASLRPATVIHGKSSSNDEESAYKTVDFLKTEAFNITRQDAEASRNNQQ